MAKLRVYLLWHLKRKEASILQHSNTNGKESCSQLLILNHAYSGHTPVKKKNLIKIHHT